MIDRAVVVTGDDFVHAVRVLTRVGLLIALVSAPSVAAGRLLCPDARFADGGVFTLDVGGVDNLDFTAQGLDLQSDGKLLLGGAGGASQIGRAHV